MASQFQIQKPYVLTTLPRPLDPATGAYVVGDVYGYVPGSRKRKRRRAELTVGIDGEAVNIYDVSSSRLVTSYPIPPQSRLSCPPSSVRLRDETNKTITRYTYSATDESGASKITLFKDAVDASGKTDQVTRSSELTRGNPAVWLAPSSTVDSELLVVRKDGETVCLDGESLEQRWTSTATIMTQDLVDSAKPDFTVEFCRSVSTAEAIKGIFKGNQDAFSVLLGSDQTPSEDSEVFILISNSGSKAHRSRHLHVLGRLPATASSAKSKQDIVQLHVMPIITSDLARSSARTYRLDVRNGSLLELAGETIFVHDLTTGIPKITSKMHLRGTSSFLSLSKTSILCSTNTQLSVFNPVYKSLQDTVEIDVGTPSQTGTEKSPNSNSQLVAYFSPLERAISIADSNLVAIQLEAPKGRHAKRRAEGLLIDSIGRGLPTTIRDTMPSASSPPKTSVFSNLLPGSVRGDYWETWQADQAKAELFYNANNISALELLLAEKFGIKVENVLTSGENTTETTAVWQLPRSRAGYPPVDRRWIIYAISRSFQWNSALPYDTSIPRLICQLPQTNTLNYLVDAGHLTLSNIKAAFRGKMGEKEEDDTFLAEQLVNRLAELDPSLELLVVYLSATNLGAVEILTVLRAIMQSLELMTDANKPLPKLLTNGQSDELSDGGQPAENENIGMELDDLEEEIQKTVSYLSNEDVSIRGRGLSMAFAKLGACPSTSAVKALRLIFKPDEILSLIYVLRIELVKGGWTDRYLDLDNEEQEIPSDAPPDGIIKLIADLLGRCLDSLGPGGWLLNDAMQADDDAVDFIGSLTHEVSAALEGVEEVVCLRNFLADPLKFYETTAKKDTTVATSQDVTTTKKPMAVRLKEASATALPLGLKSTSQHISNSKVVSGGEIVQRSLREKGHLISQKKVGSYSLERIVI
ncbi:hypothetical protein F5Y16DRAFT_369121 [Xylariaceae sp. FL0255]|nr:hypothetical protein F5Y16DRAFT_369121 [Xylariaceae sp. FL0255]